MKQLRILMLVSMWLFSQQLAVAMPMGAARMDAGEGHGMSGGCHQSASMAATGHASSHQPSSGQADEPPCCQLVCQCSISGGYAMPATVVGQAFVSHRLAPNSVYPISFPLPPEKYLFRPPIFV